MVRHLTYLLTSNIDHLTSKLQNFAQKPQEKLRKRIISYDLVTLSGDLLTIPWHIISFISKLAQVGGPLAESPLVGARSPAKRFVEGVGRFFGLR